MKYLITGLGNIGIKYAGTRHNIGFEVLDYIAQQKDVRFDSSKKGDIAKIRHKGRQIILLKPSTYMNLSGEAIRYWLKVEKIPVTNSLVVVDEIALDLGVIRLRKKGSSGGHNGLSNIEQMLNTSAYPRLRFGIGNNFPKGKQIDYVLGRWEPEEIDVLRKRIPVAAEACLEFSFLSFNQLMNNFNG